MKILTMRHSVCKSCALLSAIVALLLIGRLMAQTVGSPIQVSPAGEIVAEFSSATAPNNPELMVASAIKRLSPAKTLCAVYVSRDGGKVWSEVPACQTADYSQFTIRGLQSAPMGQSVLRASRQPTWARESPTRKARTGVSPGLRRPRSPRLNLSSIDAARIKIALPLPQMGRSTSPSTKS